MSSRSTWGPEGSERTNNLFKVAHLRFEPTSFDSRACGLIGYPTLPPQIPENVPFLAIQPKEEPPEASVNLALVPYAHHDHHHVYGYKTGGLSFFLSLPSS